MYFIFAIGIFEAVFLFLLLLTKKNKSLADIILGGAFLLFGLNILLSLIEYFNRTNGYPFPVFINSTPPFILLHGPLLWFYIKVQTERPFKFKKIHLLHFFPFLAMVTNFLITIFFLPEKVKIEMDATESFKNMPTYTIFLMMILVSPPAYYIWSLVLLKRYTHLIKNFFSKIENIDLKWLKILVGSSLLMSLIINITFFVDYFVKLAPFANLQVFSFLFVSVYVLFLGFFGLKQEAILTKIPIHQIDLNDQPKIILEKPEELFIDKLLLTMNETKPYLNPDLTLSILSQEMDVRDEYLSTILNFYLNRNFYDFINQYRVEEFKTRCKDSKFDKLTLLALAYDCGFNSKATFNRVFKINTLMTPSAYKNAVSRK